MSFDNAPDPLTTLRSDIGGCAAWTGQSLTTTHVHYIGLGASDATDTFCVLERLSHARTRFAAGAQGLASGVVAATVFSRTLTIGELEELADEIADDVVTSSGIVNLNCDSVSEARAAASDAAVSGEDWGEITMTFSYGLEA